ncbi:MAG: sulfatase activating formylglycine-generating enzyme [Planctomycetota bacterium]|jgi:formylglycine-generating enzyme required for sulfatase activity
MRVEFDQSPAGAGAGSSSPGDTWYCQRLYRDPAVGGSGFNLTDGLEVLVCPGQLYYQDMKLIPGGNFDMGRHNGAGHPSEFPAPEVILDAFYMDIHEVSSGE